MHIIEKNHVTKKPKLRFREFNDMCQVKKLGDFAEILKGKNVAKNDVVEGGKLPAIRYGELYTKYNEVISEVFSRTNLSVSDLILSKKNDVIIPASGETNIDIATASCVMTSGVALGGDLNIIRTKENGIFLSYTLNNSKKHEIASLAQGNSVVHLYPSQLKTLVISLPSIDEQEKIAEFLTAVDDKISALQKKKELLEKCKKIIMQKIFSQKICFKNEEGKGYPTWQEKRLGELFEITSSKRVYQSEWRKEGVPFYRSREVLNLINNQPFSAPIFITDELFKEYTLRYGKINMGDMLVTGVGTIGRMYLVNDSRKFYFKDGNVIWIKNNPNYSSIFIYYAFQTRSIRKQIEDNASITTVGTYTIDDAKKTRVNLPSKTEQKKITDFLTSLDDKIKLQESNLEQSKNFKKSLLQQMFV